MKTYRLSLCSIVIGLLLVACKKAIPTDSPMLGVTEPAITSMPISSTATISPTVTPTASPVPQPTRIIMISVPGAAYDDFSSWGLAEFPHQVAPLRSVDPPTTVVAHTSLATGLLPADTDILGERIHRPEDAFYWYTSAFDLPAASMPIWKAAHEQDLTSAVLFWPSARPDLPDQSADYIIEYGIRDAYSNQYQLTLAAAGTWVDAPTSFSPLLESRFTIEGDDSTIAAIYILAIDTSNDEITNPDTFILSKDRVVSPDDATLHPAAWSSWVLDSSIGQGTDFLITQSDGTSITLFQSRVYHVQAYSDTLQQEVIANFGFFPPEPDYYALEHGWITETQYIDMLRRQSDWMINVTLWVDQTYQPDLLFTVQSALEQADYQFLLTDPHQQGYSEQRAAEYADYIQQASAQVDHALGQLLDAEAQAITEGSTTVFVVSPTILAPIHTQVNLNIALSQAGFLRLGSRGFVIVQSSKAIAFSSGGAAHIYFNIAGRDVDGIVPADQYDDLQSQIVELFAAMVDPQTNEPIFAHIVATDQQEASIASDIFVQANPGYYLSDDRTPTEVFQPVIFYGQQGYDSALPQMQGALMLISPYLQPNLDQISLLDIAPSIADLLNFDVGTLDGHSFFQQR